VESPDRVLAISDFALFEAAGFDIAICSGPGGDRRECPLLCGEDCELVERADVVLHGPDTGLELLAALRRRYPELAVVVEHRSASGQRTELLPEGCIALPYPCSVGGQLDALRRALPHQA
jgi:hypothetical protein